MLNLKRKEKKKLGFNLLFTPEKESQLFDNTRLGFGLNYYQKGF